MRHFLLPRECADGECLRVEGKEFHYLCRVRRYGAGDRFPAVSPAGERFTAEIKQLDADRCTLFLRREASASAGTGDGRAWSAELTLVPALLKGNGLDEVVRQATQAGVRRILPAISERTVPRLESAGEKEKKRSRWQRIAREAVQQSGAAGAPEIAPPAPLTHISEELSPGGQAADRRAASRLGLFFHERAEESKALHDYLELRPQKIVLFIGPEGGFSEGECQTLAEHGHQAAYLGPYVLRAETAAIYAVAAVQILVLESDSWVKQSG